MKTIKMSLVNLQGKMSRKEMKEVMAGSAGTCSGTCYRTTFMGSTSGTCESSTLWSNGIPTTFCECNVTGTGGTVSRC